MAVNIYIFGTTPRCICLYNLYSYSYVHTLYICVAFTRFVRNIRPADLRGLRFPAEQSRLVEYMSLPTCADVSKYKVHNNI